MSEQQFGDVGQVQITTHGNIINQADDDDVIERRRRARYADLLRRQEEHIAIRDAADRRVRYHPCRWIPVLALVSVGATGVYELDHFSATSWLWPIQVGLLVIAGSTLLVFEHVRRDCRAIWRHHNKAVGDINEVLHTL